MGNLYDIIDKKLIFCQEHTNFAFCHASNLCIIHNGDILCTWFAGSREGNDDVAIWMSRKNSGSEEWSEPVKAAHDEEAPHWNPVLFERSDHTLLLYYKVGRVIAEWHTSIRTSSDLGYTFSPARELVPGDRGGIGPVRCKMVRLSDHSVIAGASVEKGIWTAYADRSEDEGLTFTRSNPIRIDVSRKAQMVQSDIPLSQQSFEGRGVIQPTIWEDGHQKVHMLLRSSEGRIYRSDSEDFGRSWKEAYPTSLPNNNSGIDVVRTQDGLLALCMNPVAENFGRRTPMTLMISSDNGSTWEKEADLDDAPQENGLPGEYSYPCILERGRDLFISYTYNRKSIRFIHMRRK